MNPLSPWVQIWGVRMRGSLFALYQTLLSLGHPSRCAEVSLIALHPTSKEALSEQIGVGSTPQ